MAGKNTAVFGIYRDRATVEDAVDMLRQAGFRHTDISVLFPYNEGTKDFAAEKNTKAPEGTAAGAGTGAVIGSRADHGRPGWRRCRRRHRGPHGSPGWNGYPGI